MSPPADNPGARRRPPRNALRPRAILAVALSTFALHSCRGDDPSPRDRDDSASPTPAPPASEPSPDWVTVYDPDAAWNGYTLTLHEARTPMLLDMNGRVVHSWPQARLRSRVRLLPDGSILGIDLGRILVEHDWEGRQTLALRTPGAIPHHDVIRLANGNTLALVLRDGASTDTLLELDRAGAVVWSWEAAERLGDLLPNRPARRRDVTHVNSVQELPDNPWHAAGDERFRPGNLLLSARNLHTVFVVDKRSGEVVWSFRDGLDMQHEALMNGPGLPGAGLVQLFNNRRASFGDDRQSELLELDPSSGEIVWRFRAPGFFSSTGGTQQALPNGNVLVTSTRGGRVFELTRGGEIVWQWVPPHYEPIRALRVAPDATPQLAALSPQRRRAVVPPPGYRHVDPEAYLFARRGSRTALKIDGTRRQVLRGEHDCRDLLLPGDPSLRLAWGVDRQGLRAAGPGEPPTFLARLEPAAGEPIELLRDRVGSDGPAWRERTLSLAAWSGQRVQLCVEIAGGSSGDGNRRFAYWEQPWITASGETARAGAGDDDDGDPPAADLSPEELEVRKRHLETLGYVN